MHIKRVREINELFNATSAGEKVVKAVKGQDTKNIKKHDNYAKMIWISVRDGLYELKVQTPGRQRTEFSATSPVHKEKSLEVAIKVSPPIQNQVQHHLLYVNDIQLEVSEYIIDKILSEIDKEKNKPIEDDVDKLFDGF